MDKDAEDILADDPEIEWLGELAEELTRRLESGESLNDATCLAATPARAGPIDQILPTLRAMVSLGDQVAREAGARSREQRTRKRRSS